MESLTETDSRLIKYLLGQLPEADRDRLEEQYFVDDDLFGELLDAEEQLINDYVNGRLSAAVRERFERHFLTQPDRRRRVDLDRALCRPGAGARPEARPEPWWQSVLAFWRTPRLVAAAALLAIALGGVWAGVRIFRLERLLDESRAQQAEAAARAGSEAGLANARAIATGPQAQLALALAPGLTRGAEESRKVIVPRGANILALTLDCGAEAYPGYEASLSNLSDQGAELLVYRRLTARVGRAGREVDVSLPLANLPSADYQVTLAGLGPNSDPAPIGKYYFSLRREQ